MTVMDVFLVVDVRHGSIWVFPKIVVPPNHPIVIGFSIIFTIHFGGFPPIFGNIHLKFCFGVRVILVCLGSEMGWLN